MHSVCSAPAMFSYEHLFWLFITLDSAVRFSRRLRNPSFDNSTRVLLLPGTIGDEIGLVVVESVYERLGFLDDNPSADSREYW